MEKITSILNNKQLLEQVREFSKITGYIINNKNNYFYADSEQLKTKILKEYYLQWLKKKDNSYKCKKTYTESVW